MMGLSKPSKGRVIVTEKKFTNLNLILLERSNFSLCSNLLIESDIISNIKTIFSSEELNLNKLKKAWYCSALDEFISLDYALRIYKKDDFNFIINFLNRLVVDKKKNRDCENFI